MRPEAEPRREYWVAELANLSGSFGSDSSRAAEELRAEIARDGLEALLDHLRFCGAVPERYGHDSSEEKLYSKYTRCRRKRGADRDRPPQRYPH